MARMLKEFTKEQFIKGNHAVDHNGNTVPIWSETAIQFDLHGAVCREFLGNQSAQIVAHSRLKRLIKAMFPDVYKAAQLESQSTEPKLYQLSDQMNFVQVRKVIAMS